MKFRNETVLIKMNEAAHDAGGVVDCDEQIVQTSFVFAGGTRCAAVTVTLTYRTALRSASVDCMKARAAKQYSFGSFASDAAIGEEV